MSYPKRATRVVSDLDSIIRPSVFGAAGARVDEYGEN